MTVSATARPARRVWQAWPHVAFNQVTLGGAVSWMVLVLLAALLPGTVSPDDPTVLSPTRALQPPGGVTALGTDQYGRSILTLLIYGARTAVTIGLCATALALTLGGMLGLVAGYAGRWLDMAVGRVMDVFMSFPGILLALMITAALGRTTTNLIIAVGVASVPAFYRLMRGQVLAVSSRLYVEAARSAGFRPSRIVFRHVLPNALAPVIVLATVEVGTSIVLGASLSFLGLGPRRDVPDWGQLLAQGQPYLDNAWWVSTLPGIALTLTVIAVSLLGDWLRDHLDAD